MWCKTLSALVGLSLCAVAIILPSEAVAAPAPPPHIHNVFITLPSPSATDLDRGYIDKGQYRNVSATTISVVESTPRRPWTLTVRSRDSTFTPGDTGKPVEHLLWKHNDENENSFRRLTTIDQVVYSSASGESREIYLDLRFLVNWNDSPGLYGVDLVFTTVYQ